VAVEVVEEEVVSSFRTVEEEVGFEPTEGSPLHALSRTAQSHPPPVASVPTSTDVGPTVAGERPRTGVSETRTEPRAWATRDCRRLAHALADSVHDCRATPWTLNLARQGLVGTHQDLIGGHEAKSLLIADSERIAHCGPSLIASAD
jgi:hypothetical protein